MIWLAALLIASHPTLLPAEPKRSYRAHRSPTCGDWRIGRSPKDDFGVLFEVTYNNWFYGYVTGFNARGFDSSGDLLGSTKWADVRSFMDEYCARNPSHLFVEALEPLIAELISHRPRPDKRKSAPLPGHDTRRPAVAFAATCRDWNAARNDRVLRLVYGGATRGYLTAYNRWGPDQSGDVLLAGNDPLIDAWTDDWCGKHPPAYLLQSADEFIGHLKQERAAGRLAPGTAKAIENVVPIAQAPT